MANIKRLINSAVNNEFILQLARLHSYNNHSKITDVRLLRTTKSNLEQLLTLNVVYGRRFLDLSMSVPCVINIGCYLIILLSCCEQYVNTSRFDYSCLGKADKRRLDPSLQFYSQFTKETLKIFYS